MVINLADQNLLTETSINVPHNRITWSDSEIQAVTAIIQSGYWANGPKVIELENKLAKSAGATYAVGVASGLSALRLILKALGLEPGDRVLVPAYSCVALANAVLSCGAQPVPVDVIPGEWNLDVTAVKQATALFQPKAIIAVNTFGIPAPVEQMRTLNIPIVEDCAHAFGITQNNLPLGNRTDAATLSFYATKLIGAGEGGAVLTNSFELAQFIRTWRDYSDQPPEATRLNDKMTDLEAALAVSQLERLPAMIQARYNLARRYQEYLIEESTRTHLFGLPDIDRSRVWYRYAVEINRVPARVVVNYLQRRGVQAAEPVTDWRLPNMPVCPVTDRAYSQLVSLPLYPTLTVKEQNRVIQTFLSFIRETANV